MPKTWLALGLIAAGGRIVLRLSLGPKPRAERAPRRARRRLRRAAARGASPAQATREGRVMPSRAPVRAAAAAVAPARPAASREVEPETIVIGEPVPPELASPARRAKRAARLVVAIVWVSVLLAVGLLVLVRVLIAMFDRLGG